jgi:hypothetical protein
VVLEATTCPLIGCPFYLRGGDFSPEWQIQAFNDDQQVLSKFP